MKKKRKSKKGSKKKGNHRSESHKELIHILIKRLKYNKDRKVLKKKMESDKTVGLRFSQNYKKNQKKLLTNINNDISDIKGNDSLNVSSDQNDSFIQSFLKEMIKH